MMRTLLSVAVALLLSPVAFAQHAGHAEHAMPVSQDATVSEEEQGRSVVGRGTATGGEERMQGEAAVDPHASPHPQTMSVPHSQMDHATPAQDTSVDHSQMERAQPAQDTPVDHSQMHHATPAQDTSVDHSQMEHAQPAQDTPGDHSQMHHATPTQDTSIDHSQMEHAQPVQDTPVDHSQMHHAAPAQDTPVDHSRHDMQARARPRMPIPPITDADRAAASFTGGHAAHDDGTHAFVLVDRLEATDGDHGRGQAWEVQAWVGKDIDKLWLRSEGERVEGRTESADVELLYGRAISPWWDLVAGIRHDFQPGDAQDHVAIGVIGMAPYKFEVEATAYLGESGDLSARFEAEYDTLLTNRLILQWLAEAELHGDDDPARGIGSGLSTIEAGLRLRYEIRREFAPYVGLVRERAFGDTAALRRTLGDPVDDTLVVAGVRIWF